MRNRAINALNYTGIVTLSQYIGTKKIKLAQVHNTGGSSLFNFLANCLAGEFDVAKANIPTKIRLLNRIGDADNYIYSPITSSIFLRTPPEPSFTTGESRVKFSFIIPRDFLDSASLTSTPDNTLCLGLYANSVSEDNWDNFMAFCELDSLGQSILANAYLVVDWELIITNSVKT